MKTKHVVAIIVASITAVGAVVASLVSRNDSTIVIIETQSASSVTSLLSTNNTLSNPSSPTSEAISPLTSSTPIKTTDDNNSSRTSISSDLPMNVTLDPNGGTVSYEPITVYFGGHYPELEVPNRDYYSFDGWYTSEYGGHRVKGGDIVNNSDPHTLYAHWVENDLSDWVLEPDKPDDAKTEEEKWTYTLTETLETTNSSEPSWIQIGYCWEQTDTGKHIYANFPSNSEWQEYYDHSDRLYKTYNNSACAAFETETTKREITNEQVKSYIYYHWVYPLSGNHSETNRIIGEYRGKPIYNNEGAYRGTADIWESFEGDYVEYDPKYDAYVITGHSIYSYCWNGRIPVCVQSYTDYEKVYQYKREITKESESEVTVGGNISNVQKYVKYRKK